MLQQQRPGAGGDFSRRVLQVDVVRIETAIDIDGPGTGESDRIGDDDMSGDLEEHLVPRTDLQRAENPEQPDSSGRETVGVADPNLPRELALIGVDRWTTGEVAGIEEMAQGDEAIPEGCGPAQQRDMAADSRAQANWARARHS